MDGILKKVLKGASRMFQSQPALTAKFAACVYSLTVVPDTSFALHTLSISKRAGTGVRTETFPTVTNPSLTEVTYCTLQPRTGQINLCHLTGYNHCLTNSDHHNCIHLVTHQPSVIVGGFVQEKILLSQN